MIDFSPSKEHTEVLSHVGEMMSKMGWVNEQDGGG
jgi:hypothetical protein